ncbi:MAG: YceI family protein [Candidatus Competibacteraceae bacterium]|nr:YceI family protein [Candidatus Competibacteraceae bacterium]
MKPWSRALVLSVMIAGSCNVQAVEYRHIQIAQSAVTFTYQQMGVTMEGTFGQWVADLRFDPDQPTAAQVTVDVDLAHIDTGSAEGNTEVAGKAWLNTPTFPTARFVAKSVEPLGDQRYTVTGSLTIKGRTQNIVIPTTFTSQGPIGVFAGHFTLHRADFAIGEGPWAAFDVVANDIQIQFRMTVHADTAPSTTAHLPQPQSQP